MILLDERAFNAPHGKILQPRVVYKAMIFACPRLLHLKEIESLEKRVKKVGRIDLHTGETGGLDARMSKSRRLETEKKDEQYF